jgi:hypothetical protein
VRKLPSSGETDTSAEIDQDDYSPADLEALLADTQPVRVGEEAQVVPFNEILEEIDAGLQGEEQELDLEEFTLEEAGEAQAAVTEAPLGETLPEEAEQIAEEVEALSTEEAEQALEEIQNEFEVPAEQDQAALADIDFEAAADLPSFDLEDQDASLAWLESLAAKHGVAEEELFTRPEERPAETPAWIEQERTKAGDAVEQAESEEPGEPEAEIEIPEPDALIEATDLEDITVTEQIEESAFTLPEWSEAETAEEEPIAEEELPEENLTGSKPCKQRIWKNPLLYLLD